jgi:hypothetical protein
MNEASSPREEDFLGFLFTGSKAVPTLHQYFLNIFFITTKAFSIGGYSFLPNGRGISPP